MMNRFWRICDKLLDAMVELGGFLLLLFMIACIIAAGVAGVLFCVAVAGALLFWPLVFCYMLEGGDEAIVVAMLVNLVYLWALTRFRIVKVGEDE